MYHSITTASEPGVSPYYQVNTTPAVFRQHMQFLADHGFHTICPDDLANLLPAPYPPRRTPGVIRHAAHLEFPNAQDVQHARQCKGVKASDPLCPP